MLLHMLWLMLLLPTPALTPEGVLSDWCFLSVSCHFDLFRLHVASPFLLGSQCTTASKTDKLSKAERHSWLVYELMLQYLLLWSG